MSTRRAPGPRSASSASDSPRSGRAAEPNSIPEIHRCVRPPRPPRLRALLELARVLHVQNASESGVVGRKRIGLAERPHRDVLRRAALEPGNLPQARQQRVGVRIELEPDRAVANCARELAYRLRLPARHVQARQIGSGKNCRGWKHVRNTAAPAMRSPSVAAIWPAMRVARRVVVRCFRIASVASSCAFQHPGARKPGSSSSIVANAASARSVCTMAAQSALRSNMARIRSMIGNSERASPN